MVCGDGGFLMISFLSCFLVGTVGRVLPGLPVNKLI